MEIFSPLIEQAIELAAQWHDSTYRKNRWREPAFEPPEAVALGVPVMAHVTAVAMTVQRAGWDEATVAAAFLHDVLEDLNRYGQTFRREQMRTLMGGAVTALVETVTEQKLDDAGARRKWRDRKETYVARLRVGTPEAAAISLADKLHNLWSINESLDRGLAVFTPGDGRRALSAGPQEQLWFNKAVIAASSGHPDPRLAALRARLEEEIDRFRELAGLS